MGRQLTLDAFLARSLRTGFRYGSHDCLLWPSDWVLAIRGDDPAALYRGRYRTRLGAERILNKEGGLLALAERQAAVVGLLETTSPIRGDVGVLQVIDQHGRLSLAGGICTGRHWNVLAPCGLLGGEAPPVKAWRV